MFSTYPAPYDTSTSTLRGNLGVRQTLVSSPGTEARHRGARRTKVRPGTGGAGARLLLRAARRWKNKLSTGERDALSDNRSNRAVPRQHFDDFVVAANDEVLGFLNCFSVIKLLSPI